MIKRLFALAERARPQLAHLFPFLVAAVGLAHAGALAAPITAATKTAQQEFHPAELQIKHLSDAARRLRSAALMLVNDVEQRDMVVTGEPMIMQPIPMKDDTHKIGWAQEMEDLGPALPPRKKWLDLDMSSAGQLLDLLQQDMEGTQFPAEKQDNLAGPWGEVKAIVQDAQAHYRSLKTLTQGPAYDNISIGKEALAIYDDMGKLEKPLKQVLQVLRSRA